MMSVPALLMTLKECLEIEGKSDQMRPQVVNLLTYAVEVEWVLEIKFVNLV